MQKTSIKEKTSRKLDEIGFFLYKYSLVAIQIPLNMIVAFFNHTEIEIVIAMISFVMFRYDFPKTYHCNSVSRCMMTTSVIFWITSLILSQININISLFIHILIGACIGFLAFLTQCIIEDIEQENTKSRRKRIINKLENNTNIEYIIEYCKNKGFKSDIADTIHIFLSNTIEESCNKLYITPTTLDYRLNKFLESK